MKKTIIALAVAAFAASSANATVIYEKEGTKIDLDGRAHFEIINQKGSRTDLTDAGSRVRVRAFQEIAEGLQAYGGAEFRFSKDSIGDNMRTHRLYGGFIHKDIGTLTLGRQLHLGDHIPKANYTYEWGGNSFFDSHNKAVSFISAKFNGFRLGADYYFGDANKENIDDGQGYGVGLFYDGKLTDDLSIRFGSGYTDVKTGTNKVEADPTANPPVKEQAANEYKLKRGGVGFDVKYKNVTFGIDWAFARAGDNNNHNLGFQKVATPKKLLVNKNDRFLVGLKVDVTEQNAVYGQYYFGKAKEANRSADSYKMHGWMIGADHRVNKNVAFYLEGGTGKVKQGDTTVLKNHRVLVGTRILF
ncbi:hypothetical protein A4G18_03850 [Pasteurellaceae bacterium Pebbles2]|nr:hypothetical protein [Pasteurellaceae bacterium Pebbles2]